MVAALEEYDRICDARKDTSRFFKVALHIHSPGSHDFGRTGSGDPALNDKARLSTPAGKAEFLQALQQNLDLVAITDHMKCGYAVSLSAMPCPRPHFCVLPGMEINVRLAPPLDTNRVHLLAIFPPGTSVDQINRIFVDTHVAGEDRRDGQRSEVTNVSLSDFVARIRKQGGLPVLAHVDSSPTGIRCLWHQTAKDFLGLLDPSGKIPPSQLQDVSEKFKTLVCGLDVAGVEVSKPEHRKHYSWLQSGDGQRRDIPVLMSLDAHSLEDLARTQSYCHVKMTDVSFEGLQSALKMPHTRIRFANDLPTPPSPAVLGISLISSPGSGFFESALVGLSDNLTCIIGPRGSGKSTIVDALRYAFGYNRTLHELEDDPGLPKAIKARQASNLRDTLIRVYYRLADQTVHVLEATYDPKAEYATRVFTLDGHPVGVDDVEKSGQYPLRLFGWSEIETLGRSPVHQRQLVDRLIPDLASLLEKRSSLRLELKESAQRLLGIAQALSTLFEQDNQVITRFTEYRADFERLNTPEMQRHFASLDLARRKARALQLARQALADQAQKLKDNDPATLLGKIERTLQAAGVDVATWWRETGARALDFDDQFAKAGGAQGQATGLFIALGERLAQLESEAESEGTALEARIREALASDTRAQVAANQRSQAESRLARATKARQDYSAEYDKFEAELKARQEVCRKLAAKQLEISGARNTQRDELVGKLNHFRTDLFAIDLVFKSGGDRIPLSDHLSAAKGFLSNLGVQSRNRKWPELLSRRFNPLQLADALWSKNEALLAVTEEIEGEQRSISAAQAADLIAKRHPVRHHEGADVCLVDRALLQMLLDVEGVPWDDLVQITLNGQSVDNLSPGQRSSAMLPLIALSQSSPLVIDQPEDNLDNRLVGKVVANILAELKEQRQVIVATHNPNIVVAGDAEQVIVLDAVDNKRGKVLEAGSIDHSRIAERVIELLEGGRDAFRIRKERYGF